MNSDRNKAVVAPHGRLLQCSNAFSYGPATGGLRVPITARGSAGRHEKHGHPRSGAWRMECHRFARGCSHWR